MSTKLFYIPFAIEFCSWLINVSWSWRAWQFYRHFHHIKRTVLLSTFYLAVGISLIISFEVPGQINHSNQKGLAGLYCICSAYSLFRTSKDLLQPSVFEMVGWFEVVFKNIIKLLAVSIHRQLGMCLCIYLDSQNDKNPLFKINFEIKACSVNFRLTVGYC